MGTRWILMNCFGMRRPKRAPTPPAGMTTATRPTMSLPGMGFTLEPSAEQRRQGVADRGHAVDVERHLRRLEDIAPRHDRPAEAQGGRLAQTQLKPRDGTDFSGEPHLADHEHVVRHRSIHVARRRGDDDSQIHGGLRHSAAARDVDEHVLAPERTARALLENRQQQAHAVVVGAEHRPARGPDGGMRDEGLQLQQHRPRALETRDDDRAGRLDGTLGEEEAGGVLHLDQPPSAISKTPISFVEPNRFFTARRTRYAWWRSPSKYSTVSTRCSRTRGPASAPSFVTWPTRNVAMPRPLASVMRRAPHSRTCVTLPGADSSSGRNTVWMESMTSPRGFTSSS